MRTRRTQPHLAPLALAGTALATLLATGCNQYEFFALAGYEQASFNNRTDVVFIVDNSSSMQEEAGALATNFDVFLDRLEGGGGDDSPDSVNATLDYQLAITTTSVDTSKGPTNALDPGEAGTLVGDPIAAGSANIRETFLDQLLCDTVNWNAGQLPDISYECGSGTPDEISEDYLDCVCGDAWKDNSGGGVEEPLEAALMTLCRTSESPPDFCFHEETEDTKSELLIEEAETGSYQTITDLVREDSTTVFVLITDEGDDSRQLQTGEDDPSLYLSEFDGFDTPVRWAVIGPRFDPETSDASSCGLVSAGVYERESQPYWSVNRLYVTANAGGGFYEDITSGPDGDGQDCGLSDFSVHLERLAELLTNLVNAFELASIPDVSTIRVFVDGKEVSEASLLDTDGAEAVYSDGWTYDAGQNSVIFWGTAIPGYDAQVEIYYRPLEGKPRELPF